MNLLTKISYGLYIITTSHDGIDNGCIANTLIQQTEKPLRFSVTLNNDSYTCQLAKQSKILGAAILSTDTSFETIKWFGMNKGSIVEKFAAVSMVRAKNGVAIPTKSVIGYFELKVVKFEDLGTHTLFICDSTNEVILQEGEPVTYAYYHTNIRPKSSSDQELSYVCTICGYEHVGEVPDDFICPLCNHGKDYFEKKNN